MHRRTIPMSVDAQLCLEGRFPHVPRCTAVSGRTPSPCPSMHSCASDGHAERPCMHSCASNGHEEAGHRRVMTIACTVSNGNVPPCTGPELQESPHAQPQWRGHRHRRKRSGNDIPCTGPEPCCPPCTGPEPQHSSVHGLGLELASNLNWYPADSAQPGRSD